MYNNTSDYEYERIKSLAKLYDSIPDYCDIKNLPENEFNSVLVKLRENSLKLRCKSASTYNLTERNQNKNQIDTAKTIPSTILTSQRPSTAITSYSAFKDSTKYSKTKYGNTNRKKSAGSKKGKKSLKKSYSMSELYDEMDALDLKSDELYSPVESTKEAKNSINLAQIRSNPPSASKSKKKFKSIFASIIPNLISPTIYPCDPKLEPNISDSSNSPKKKSAKKASSKPSDINSFLGTDLKKADSKMKVSLSATPSPVYPAARSNLAATLRAQLSHKPHQEPSPTPSELKPKSRNRFNWDVKRTPGWKSLIYRETNKEDIMYRLATRRAEQKLQKQEYDMNMELMRQRVKSAPLLLEGMTYWNTRLTNRSFHNCFTTASSRLSTRRKKNSARKIKPLQQQINSEHQQSQTSQNQTFTNGNNNSSSNCNQFNDNDDLTEEDRAYL